MQYKGFLKAHYEDHKGDLIKGVSRASLEYRGDKVEDYSNYSIPYMDGRETRYTSPSPLCPSPFPLLNNV